jgi:hypothetical protein
LAIALRHGENSVLVLASWFLTPPFRPREMQWLSDIPKIPFYLNCCPHPYLHSPLKKNKNKTTLLEELGRQGMITLEFGI